MTERLARELVVHGRVQGVFFRASTRERARENGVGGWVRNDPDGTVTIRLEGDPDAVGTVERWAHEGPRAARVERVEARDVDPEGHGSFSVRS